MRSLLILLGFFALIPVSCRQTLKNKEVSPKEDLKIFPIEYASMILEWNDITIYIDPVGNADRFAKYKQPDLILITHSNGDNFDLKTLEGLNTERAKIIVTNAVANQMPNAFTPQIDVLGKGESKERFDITIQAVPADNFSKENPKVNPKKRGNGYLLESNGIRIYISGDTEYIPEASILNNIDHAFIGMNLPSTMTVESVVDGVLDFKPKKIYPYHYRGINTFSDIKKFKELVMDKNPNIEVEILNWQ